MSDVDCDILVIGGGINGCGVARDAAGRGFNVLLVEKNDLASGTSSASTKLIHGGLRYLEYYEFRLVREALAEREVLWRMAPHIIWPLRFVLPHHKALRPAWLLRLGLFLYDHIGGRKLLPTARSLDLRIDEAGKPLRPGFTRGFEYSDAWVQDSRLVVLNAQDAQEKGAGIRTRTAVTGIRREAGVFQVDLRDERTGKTSRVSARLVVNAAGPWVDQVRQLIDGKHSAPRVRLVQGSHIIVPKLFDHDRCYIFQNADSRIVFAIPYEHDYTLIGTTDRDYSGDTDKVEISPEETVYLCEAASSYFQKSIAPDDVVWTYSGVRPLYDDHASSAQEATRDYVLERDGDRETGAIIHIFGGKITTYRRLSEAVLEKIEEVLGERSPAWTSKGHLPGGDFPVSGFESLVARLAAIAPDVEKKTLMRLARNYGTCALSILDDGSLGSIFGADLGENEVRYLIDKEWALTSDDILWRRSKLGLKFTPEEVGKLDAYLRENTGHSSGALSLKAD